MLARCRAPVNHQPILKHALLFRRNEPVAQPRDIRIDQSLLVGAPAARMVGISRMIEDDNAERLVSERPLDVAPYGTLLFAFPTAESIDIEINLA